MADSRQKAAERRDSKPEQVPVNKPEVVRVRLLGRFEVSVGSRIIGEDEWRLRKVRSLIKLLALTPRHRLQREQVMYLLWPDSDPEAAANNLRYALHHARRAFEPVPASPSHYLRLSDEELALCPETPLWVDVEAFEDAAATARRSRAPSAYRVALELYTGDLLPEDRYEPWAEGRRETLRSICLTLLAELAGLHEECGEYKPAIEALERVLSEEPDREGTHAGLMRLYAHSGRRGEALRQYERLGEILRREFGTEPGAEIGRLREEIASGRFPPARPSPEDRPSEAMDAGPHNLPVARSSFVGREREVVEVKRSLAMTGLLTLTGAGGSGKTRLALEVARELVGAYPDGVWLVELAPLLEGELVAQEVADTLEVREQPNRPLADTLAQHLRGKKTLLVLDNCEHLLDAAARLVDALLGTCAHLRILATSREALGVAGEANWPVPPLSVPDTDGSPADLMRYEAVRLFVERARLRLPTFDLTPTNARAVAEVCRKLDGIPLAIELVTGRVAALAVDQVAQKLEDTLSLLTTGPRTATPRHQTMRATIEWSYTLLNEPEQALFRQLSVFAGGWDMEATEAAGVGDGIERSDVLDLIDRLVDKSLVVAESGTEEAFRYRLLEPIRQYAREKLEESGEADAIRSRHAKHYLALAEEAEPELQGAQAERWLGRLETEHDNLRAALAWALGDGDRELGLRLAGTLGVFWQMRGHLKEAWRWLEAALSEEDAPASTRVKALSRAAFMGVEQGEFERSISLGEEALTLSRETGDEAGVAAALYNLGYAAMFQEELEKAGPMFEEAVALWRELGDNVGLAYALQGLGLTVMVQGDFGRAVALFEEGLVLAREAGDMAVTELLLLALALAALGQDDYEKAREICAEAVELARRLDYGHATAANLHILASAAGSEGQPVRAARLWGAAEALREAIGATLSPVERTFYARYIAAARDALDNTTWEAAWAEGRKMTPEQAVEYALPAEEPPLPTSLRSARVKALTWASWMAWSLGDFEPATALGEEGLALARAIGDTAGIAAALQNLGMAKLRNNELGRASELFEEAVALQREIGDTAGVDRSLQALGLIAVVWRDHARAQALFEEGLALNQETGDRMGTVMLLGLGALTALGRGDHQRTRELCEQGSELARQLGMRHGVGFNLQILACLAGAQGQPVRAARLWGAIDALGETIGTKLVPVERYHYGPYIDAARERLDAASWEAAWAEGRKMSLEEAVEYALPMEELVPPVVPLREEPPSGKQASPLTRREGQVAILVARGLTDRQIASELTISERTVTTHLSRILKKLGLQSRAQLAAWITEQRLRP